MDGGNRGFGERVGEGGLRRVRKAVSNEERVKCGVVIINLDLFCDKITWPLSLMPFSQRTVCVAKISLFSETRCLVACANVFVTFCTTHHKYVEN